MVITAANHMPICRTLAAFCLLSALAAAVRIVSAPSDPSSAGEVEATMPGESFDHNGWSSLTEWEHRSIDVPVEILNDSLDPVERERAGSATPPSYVSLLDRANMSAPALRRSKSTRGSKQNSRPSNSTWKSGHRIIFMRHGLSVANSFGEVKANPIKGWTRFINARKDACLETCACLPYNLTRGGRVTASCVDTVESDSVVARDSLLTKNGIVKAKKHGIRLRKVLEKENVAIKKFLISPMRRTLQTALLTYRDIMKDNVEVIPNLHEAYLSESDLVYGGETTWHFLMAMQENFKEERTSVISTSTMNAFKEQLNSLQYADQLRISYDIDSEGNPIKEKVKKKGSKTSYTQFFHQRMASLRKYLLSLEKGTYAIVSHGGVGTFFFPGNKLANLGTIVGELNGNDKVDDVFHEFEEASSWSVHAAKLAGWRDD